MNAQTKSAIRRWLIPPALGLLLACNLSAPAGSPAPAETGAGATANLPPQGTSQPGNTVAPPTDTPRPTATFTIVHLTTPPGTTGTTRYITDFDTKPYAPQKKAIGGDDYSTNRYERPYTAGEMVYLSDVDLKRVDLRIAAPWVYLTFEFSDPRPEGIGVTRYGAEFDTNKDGRGEFLVWGLSPADGEWTTDGVEMWQDTNHDVGGPAPQVTNAPWTTGDGYDKNLVADGVGPDPDLAWIRQIEGGTKVQLAFKYSAIADVAQFLWNGLADGGVQHHEWFDYNDHFTQAEAGSPYPIQTQFYPLKGLAAIDNTCRDAFGFTPVGNEPGLCAYYGSISGTVFRDYDENGLRNGPDPGVSLGSVLLGQGACPSSGFKTASFGAPGVYTFKDLLIGTYCVSHSFTFPDPTYHRTTPGAVTVTLAPNDAKTVNFGLNWIEPPA